MNRPIKFRAWGTKYRDDSEPQMIYPDEHTRFKDSEGAMPGHIIEITREQFDYKWMQYTGLKDRNGEEIYEGDIVKLPKTLLLAGSIGKVEMVQGCWMITDKDGDIIELVWDSTDKYKCKVIGNIYENPELLEECRHVHDDCYEKDKKVGIKLGEEIEASGCKVQKTGISLEGTDFKCLDHDVEFFIEEGKPIMCPGDEEEESHEHDWKNTNKTSKKSKCVIEDLEYNGGIFSIEHYSHIRDEFGCGGGYSDHKTSYYIKWICHCGDTKWVEESEIDE